MFLAFYWPVKCWTNDIAHCMAANCRGLIAEDSLHLPHCNEQSRETIKWSLLCLEMTTICCWPRSIIRCSASCRKEPNKQETGAEGQWSEDKHTASCHSTLSFHIAIPHCHGTLPWHSAISHSSQGCHRCRWWEPRMLLLCIITPLFLKMWRQVAWPSPRITRHPPASATILGEIPLLHLKQ